MLKRRRNRQQPRLSISPVQLEEKRRQREPLIQQHMQEPEIQVAPTPSALSGGPKKVLVIAHNHPEFFPGGGELLAYQLFQELKRLPGYAPIFLAAASRLNREAHPGTPFLAFEGREDEFLFWGDRFDYFLQSQSEPLYLYRDFARFLEEQKPDVVHLHHTIRLGMETLRILRDVLPHARIVYTLHDFIPICHRDGQMLRKSNDTLCDHASPARCHECFPEIPSAHFKMREQFIKAHFDLVDAFTSPSHLLMERYRRWGLPQDKLHHIPNGTLARETTPVHAAREGTRNRFAYFGQISPYKGTLLLVEAARILKERGITDFRVDIHGNVSLQTEEYRRRFEEAVEDCEGYVQFHGRYEHRELPTLMSEADWVVMTSIWWENSPLVIAESFAYGRPVICSDIGGMAEHVADGTDGLHFRTGSAQALADVMAYAIKNEEVWPNLHAGITPPLTMRECLERYLPLFEADTQEKRQTP